MEELLKRYNFYWRIEMKEIDGFDCRKCGDGIGVAYHNQKERSLNEIEQMMRSHECRKERLGLCKDFYEDKILIK